MTQPKQWWEGEFDKYVQEKMSFLNRMWWKDLVKLLLQQQKKRIYKELDDRFEPDATFLSEIRTIIEQS